MGDRSNPKWVHKLSIYGSVRNQAFRIRLKPEVGWQSFHAAPSPTYVPCSLTAHLSAAGLAHTTLQAGLPFVPCMLRDAMRSRHRHIRSRVGLLLAIFITLSNAKSHSLKWTSPSSETVYGPGDTIVGQWTSNSTVVSPSVSLCSQSSDDDDGSDNDEGDCGGTVWPSLNHNGNQYSISLWVFPSSSKLEAELHFCLTT